MDDLPPYKWFNHQYYRAYQLQLTNEIKGLAVQNVYCTVQATRPELRDNVSVSAPSGHINHRYNKHAAN